MADIVTVPEGTFTPGAQATLDFSAALINAAWNLGGSNYAAFQAKTDLVTNAGGTGWLDTAATPTVSAGTSTGATPTEPAVTIPATLTAEEVIATFDTKQQALWDQLVAGMASFRTSFFPDEAAAYSAAESWLAAAVASPSGIPAAVQAQMLTDDKDRALAESSRAADAVIARFAASRLPMPPDAESAAVVSIQQAAQGEIAASARKVTIAGIENLKFAVGKLIDLRQVAMGAALDHIKTMATAAPAASQVVGSGYESQSRLISAASSYYGARTSAADLATKNEQFNVANALNAAEKNQAASLAMIGKKLDSILGEAEVLGRISQSLFANLHSSSGTGYSVSGNDGS